MSKEWRGRWYEASWNKHHDHAYGVNYHHGFYFSRKCRLSIHAGPLSLFLTLPWRSSDEKQANDCEWPTYGLTVQPRVMTLHTGKHQKNFRQFRFPWDWEFYRRSYLCKDGEFKHEMKGTKFPPNSCLDSPHPYYDREKDEDLWVETYPYTYKLRSGKEQHVQATVRVDEMEWRWLWFTWFPFIRKVVRGIDIHFSDEVGERAGSWKGGAIGCGYNMKDGETPRETLARMERERTFR